MRVDQQDVGILANRKWQYSAEIKEKAAALIACEGELSSFVGSKQQERDFVAYREELSPLFQQLDGAATQFEELYYEERGQFLERLRAALTEGQAAARALLELNRMPQRQQAPLSAEQKAQKRELQNTLLRIVGNWVQTLHHDDSAPAETFLPQTFHQIQRIWLDWSRRDEVPFLA
eukprot:GILK01011169.1.p2 GENE.GILK01011169.1~~GILK01011169.1.p2  ORF type:complete len:176 (+),score=35.77 GILK01011169.1:338-865(+)